MQCAICGRPLTKLERPNHPLGYVGPVCIKKNAGEAQVLEALEREGTEVELRPTIAYLRRIGFHLTTEQTSASLNGEPILRFSVLANLADFDDSGLTERERADRATTLRHLREDRA